MTHGSWENGTALSTNPTPRYPRASDVNHLNTPVKEPDSNYRVTISAVPNTHTSNGRGGARRNASSLDKIKWAYTKVAMLFCISILITWVPASVNRVYGLRFPDRPSFILNIGSAIVLPLQGFVRLPYSIKFQDTSN